MDADRYLTTLLCISIFFFFAIFVIKEVPTLDVALDGEMKCN